MARIAALAFAALVAVASGCAHQGVGRDPLRTERELIQLHEQWAAARVNGDVAFLERFYGQELRLQVADGSVVARNDDIALFDRTGKSDLEVVKPEYIRDTEIRVATHNDTAIVTGVEHLKGTYKGHPGEMSLRFTNVLVWRDGRWQLVAAQATRVAAR